MDDDALFDPAFPGDSVFDCADMPDGRTRVLLRTSCRPGDIHEIQPYRRPLVLDLAARSVALDMVALFADVETRWTGEGLVVTGSGLDGNGPLRFTLDLAGARFRDDGAGDAGWRPLAELQPLVEARVPRWSEVNPLPSDDEIRAEDRAERRKRALNWVVIVAVLALFAATIWYSGLTGGPAFVRAR